MRLGDLDSAQIESMLNFLASALSADRYALAMGVVEADAVQGRIESEDRFSDENYWLAFFGEPSDGGVWGWQFGGHHLAINVSVADERSYLPPTFIGIEPGDYEANRASVAPMDAYRQAGVSLINALDEGQRSAATVSSRPGELYTGAGDDGVIPRIEGLKADGMSETQQQSLLNAIELWVGILDESSSQARLSEIRAELDETYLAWHGDPDSDSIYYRIQGPHLIIEFTTQEGEDGAAHYHSVYRNPSNEYGSSLSRQ